MATSAKVRGISIELSADSSGIVKGLKEANSAISKTQKELKDVDKLLKFNPGNITLIKQRTQALQQQISNTKTKLQELKKAEADMKSKGVDENSEQFRALQREIIQTESKLKELNNTAGSGSSTMYAISEATGKIGEKATAAGKALMPVTAGLAAIGTAAVAAFNEVDDGADVVIKKTGATGKAAEDLKDTYKKVATSVKGSFEDAGKAVGEINTRFQLTGDELEDLSSEFMKFAEITDQDVESAVVGVDLAMKTFNVDGKETKGVLGLLAKTSQRTGISVDTLENALQNSGAQLKEMGLDLGASVTLMGNFEAAGIDSNTMLARLGKGAATFSKNGMNMQEGLDDLISRLQNSSTESEATAEAYEIFGSRGALAFITAAKEGKLAFDGLSTDLNNYKDVVGETYEGILDETDQAQILWKELKVTLAEVGASLLKTLAPALKKAAEFVKGLSDGWRNLDDGTKKTIISIGGIVAAIGPALMIFGKLATAISAITKVMSTMKFATFLTNPVTLAITAVAALVGGIIALVNAYNDGIKASHPFREELDNLKKSSEETGRAIDDNRQSYIDAAESAQVQAEKAQFLSDRLNELMGVEEKSAAQKEEIKQLVKQLNEIMPELSLAYDDQADSLNRTNEEISTNIKLMKAQAEADAASKAYGSAIENRLKATQEYNKALDIYNKTNDEASEGAKKYAAAIEAGNWALLEGLGYTQKEKEEGEHLLEAKKALTTATENYNTSISDEADFEKILQDTNKELAKETKKTAATINKQNLKAFRQELVDTFGSTLPKELNKALNLASTYGVAIPDELRQGILDGSVDVETAIGEINNIVNEELKNNETNINENGKAVDSQMASGMDSNKGTVNKSAAGVANEVNKSISQNSKAAQNGADYTSTYSRNMERKKDLAYNSSKAVAGQANKGAADNNQGAKNGGQWGTDYGRSMAMKKELAYNSSKALATQANKAAVNNNQGAKNGGQWGTDYGRSMAMKKELAYNSSKALATQANKAAVNNNQGGARGGQWGTDYGKSMALKKELAYNSSKSLANQANRGAADNNRGGERGGQWGSGYTSGLGNHYDAAYRKAYTLAGNANNGARDHNNGYSLGSTYGKSYGDGIASQLSYAYAKGEQLAERAWRGTQAGQKSGSPSKVAIGLGHDYSEGYGIGIEDMFKKIFNIGSALANQAINGTSNYSALTANQPLALAGASAVGGQSIVNNNYTQNNYSPKALSTSEVYRQTKNLISYAGDF